MNCFGKDDFMVCNLPNMPDEPHTIQKKPTRLFEHFIRKPSGWLALLPADLNDRKTGNPTSLIENLKSKFDVPPLPTHSPACKKRGAIYLTDLPDCDLIPSNSDHPQPRVQKKQAGRVFSTSDGGRMGPSPKEKALEPPFFNLVRLRPPMHELR